MRATKVIDSHLIHDDESLARFRGEAVLARQFLQPNVVRVEDLDRTEDGRPFIMEYVVGRSLRDVLRKEPGLAQARAVDIVRRLARSSALREARIEIAVANGMVTLTGRAPTTAARDLAVHIAGSAHGVRGVLSMVEVAPTASTPEPLPPHR